MEKLTVRPLLDRTHQETKPLHREPFNLVYWVVLPASFEGVRCLVLACMHGHLVASWNIYAADAHDITEFQLVSQKCL